MARNATPSHVNETLASTARAAHDWGLASFLGGSMYGKFAMNPSVAVISDKSERGKVVNQAWSGYNLVNVVSLAAVAVGWYGSRATETRDRFLTDREKTLARVKDGLVAATVLVGALAGLEGLRLSQQGDDGAVAVETGTRPAEETPSVAARLQRRIGVLGTASIALGVGLVVVNAVLSQESWSKPPAKRVRARWFSLASNRSQDTRKELSSRSKDARKRAAKQYAAASKQARSSYRDASKQASSGWSSARDASSKGYAKARSSADDGSSFLAGLLDR